jgi:hypothetical protein
MTRLMLMWTAVAICLILIWAMALRLNSRLGRRRRLVQAQLRLENALQNTKAAWAGVTPGLPVGVFVGGSRTTRQGQVLSVDSAGSDKQPSEKPQVSFDI